MESADVFIKRTELTAPVATALIEALNAELSKRYADPDDRHFLLSADEVAESRGVFLVAYVGGQPVACGAVRRIEPGVGEIKRMYVCPSQRGRGLGRQVLEGLEREARRLGMHRVVLETGNRQAEAVALYRGAGYSQIPVFGEYVSSPLTSICMAKDL